MTDERACVRGCTVPDAHYASCPDFGRDEGACRGCAPRVARDGALICERCYRALRRCLEDAGDIVGHLRSMADPSKAAVFDRVAVRSSRPELPAPVAADLIDASDDIVRALRSWEIVLDGEALPARVPGLPAGASADGAFVMAQGAADRILDELDTIVNVRASVVPLAEALIARHREVAPPFWTVADVLARWSFEDRPRWADAPCPECDMRTVRVSPSRFRGAPTRYVCTGCQWMANSDDDGGLWADHFAEQVPEDVRPHDPRWMTLADASRLAGVTTGTVRQWAKREEVRVDAGRYWREDVEAVNEERKTA